MNIAVIGAGRIGKIHAGNAAAHPGLSVKYVVDPIAVAAEQLAGQVGARAAGLDDALSDPSVEGVVIASSTDTHLDFSTSAIEAGKAVFAANCAVCHGPDGKGKADVGAPDLTDRSRMYGGDESSLYMTVWGGRQGHMPTWESRLSPVDRKILALYLVDLRKHRP